MSLLTKEKELCWFLDTAYTTLLQFKENMFLPLNLLPFFESEDTYPGGTKQSQRRLEKMLVVIITTAKEEISFMEEKQHYLI